MLIYNHCTNICVATLVVAAIDSTLFFYVWHTLHACMSDNIVIMRGCLFCNRFTLGLCQSRRKTAWVHDFPELLYLLFPEFGVVDALVSFTNRATHDCKTKHTSLCSTNPSRMSVILMNAFLRARREVFTTTANPIFMYMSCGDVSYMGECLEEVKLRRCLTLVLCSISLENTSGPIYHHRYVPQRLVRLTTHNQVNQLT